MIETEAQKIIVDAVLVNGGAAMKYSDKFLRGGADLLIKLPGAGAFFLEAKLKKLAKSTIDTNQGFKWKADVTRLQQMFLEEWGKAEMLTGVASLLMEDGGNVNSLRMVIYSRQQMVKSDWNVYLTDHRALGTVVTRYTNIMIQLEEYAGLRKRG